MTTTTKKSFGTYKNQYGKTCTDYGPSPKQSHWIEKLATEKQLAPRAQLLLDLYNTGDLSGQQAKELLDILFAAKDTTVVPSQLGPQPDGKPASASQIHWVGKLLAEKAVPEAEATAIAGFQDEGLTSRWASKIMDYMFGLPNANTGPVAQGFIGEPGEFIKVTGTIDQLRQVLTKWGTSNLILVKTPEGKAVKTFTSAKWSWGLKPGDEITIGGEVREHENYKGQEATVIKKAQVQDK